MALINLSCLQAEKKEATEEKPDDLASQHLSETRMVDDTSSNDVFEDLITAYYIPLEIWYTRTIIDKVILFKILIRSYSLLLTGTGSSTFLYRFISVTDYNYYT